MVRKTDIVQSTIRSETKTTQQARTRTSRVPFNDLLHKRLVESSGLKFSAHAQERMRLRNIHLSDQDIAHINEAVSLAESKGARDTLVLLDHVGLIVNIKNQTVITAVDQNSLQRNVFTNIDSAVIV